MLVICQLVQLQVITAKKQYVAQWMGQHSVEGTSLLACRAAFTSLRLSCKEFRSASDNVRTSLRFSTQDMDLAAAYMLKVSLRIVAVDCRQNVGRFNDCLTLLQSMVPEMEELTLRYDPQNISILAVQMKSEVKTCLQSTLLRF